MALIGAPATAAAASPPDGSAIDEYAPSLPAPDGPTYPGAHHVGHGGSGGRPLPPRVRAQLKRHPDATAALLTQLAQNPDLGAPTAPTVQSGSVHAPARESGRGSAAGPRSGAESSATPRSSTHAAAQTSLVSSVGDALGTGTLLPLGLLALVLAVAAMVVVRRRVRHEPSGGPPRTG